MSEILICSYCHETKVEIHNPNVVAVKCYKCCRKSTPWTDPMEEKDRKRAKEKEYTCEKKSWKKRSRTSQECHKCKYNNECDLFLTKARRIIDRAKARNEL